MVQVLEQAMHAFWNHDDEATSLSDLMQAMDLQKGSIYKVFGDKHSLFLATLQRYLDMLHKINEEIIPGGRTPQDALWVRLETKLKLICGQELRVLTNSLYFSLPILINIEILDLLYI